MCVPSGRIILAQRGHAAPITFHLCFSAVSPMTRCLGLFPRMPKIFCPFWKGRKLGYMFSCRVGERPSVCTWILWNLSGTTAALLHSFVYLFYFVYLKCRETEASGPLPHSPHTCNGLAQAETRGQFFSFGLPRTQSLDPVSLCALGRSWD